MHPTLYQLNTRVHLTRLARQLGRPSTLDDLPDSLFSELAHHGFHWVWLLSVWRTGPFAASISRSHPAWREEFQHSLPDLEEADIGGSGFAITEYAVHPDLGGPAALQRVRQRMQSHGLKLLLDFVPNHVAPDHAWVWQHPDFFVAGTPHDLLAQPQNYLRLNTAAGERIIAHGRDPYFDGWPDTVQLDYSNPAVVEQMTQQLLAIAQQCDGVRCDMAMLLLPDVFLRTWGRAALEFWPQAARRIRERHPKFLLLAEVYWNREWDLQQQGFDYTYDKQLYDRLRAGDASSARDHLRADLTFQNRLARFLENHDEPRAAAVMSADQQEAAAIITYFIPGMRFFHEGQADGHLVRISPHLIRGPDEPTNERLRSFHERLWQTLRDPVFHEDTWQQLDCLPAWHDNPSHDCFLCFAWKPVATNSSVASDSNAAADQASAAVTTWQLIAVNFAPHRSQCFVRWPRQTHHDQLSTTPIPHDARIALTDRLSDARYERELHDLLTRGLYLDLPAWGYHIFTVSNVVTTGASRLDAIVVSNSPD